MKTLSKTKVKQFYDDWGIKQDNPGEYEELAVNFMVEKGNFTQANDIFEFGFGTGKFAKSLFLLTGANFNYIGQDLSETMYSIASDRLHPWSEKIKLNLTSGSVKIDLPDNSVDRFVSNFVLDILDENEIEQLLNEAHRVLRSNGLLCLSSLDRGISEWAKIKSFCWQSLYKIRPMKLGGCRPLKLSNHLNSSKWRTIEEKVFDTKGVSSSVIIAETRLLN